MRKIASSQRGFTLIELLIVMVVIAILMAIAVPSYSFVVRKGYRSTAQGCLLELSQAMERRYAANLNYTGATIAGLGAACTTELAGRYNLAFTAGPTANAFTLAATPQGDQTKDECGTMSITQTGVKTPTVPADCWR